MNFFKRKRQRKTEEQRSLTGPGVHSRLLLISEQATGVQPAAPIRLQAARDRGRDRRKLEEGPAAPISVQKKGGGVHCKWP